MRNITHQANYSGVRDAFKKSGNTDRRHSFVKGRSLVHSTDAGIVLFEGAIFPSRHYANVRFALDAENPQRTAVVIFSTLTEMPPINELVQALSDVSHSPILIPEIAEYSKITALNDPQQVMNLTKILGAGLDKGTYLGWQNDEKTLSHKHI